MSILKVVFGICFLALVGSLIYQFLTVIQKLKNQKELAFPIIEHDAEHLLSPNHAKVAPPNLKAQKGNIIIWGLIILILTVVAFFIMISEKVDIFAFLLLLVPLANTPRLISLFAISDEGVICGERFLKWNRVKSFQFIPITPNHKYYGYSRQTNEGYELKLSARVFFPISYIVTSEETKERLSDVLHSFNVIEKDEQGERID
ncbi:hypothetical protein LC040_19485 [Bacillus tianshenii]|nr:hypothetical protein LC040_19485 [Bacillus tianshenii]